VRLGVLHELSETELATATELLGRCQASMPTLRRHLDAMVAIGLVEEQSGESDGETPGRPAARFSLAPELRESVRSVIRLAM
jgi:predicted ArsR family transcriptional regulator